MRLRLERVQALFEADLASLSGEGSSLASLASDEASPSPYFSLRGLVSCIGRAPRSIRCERSATDARPTWVWCFAEAEDGARTRVGYLIGRLERWPATHLEYGIATSARASRIPIIQVSGLGLGAALDWD